MAADPFDTYNCSTGDLEYTRLVALRDPSGFCFHSRAAIVSSKSNCPLNVKPVDVGVQRERGLSHALVCSRQREDSHLYLLEEVKRERFIVPGALTAFSETVKLAWRHGQPKKCACGPSAD